MKGMTEQIKLNRPFTPEEWAMMKAGKVDELCERMEKENREAEQLHWLCQFRHSKSDREDCILAALYNCDRAKNPRQHKILLVHLGLEKARQMAEERENREWQRRYQGGR